MTSKRIVILPVARQDIAEAASQYEQLRRGLGETFAHEVNALLARVRHWPHSYQQVFPNIRRAVLHRFGYWIVYEIFEDSIVVLGVQSSRLSPMSIFDRVHTSK